MDRLIVIDESLPGGKNDVKTEDYHGSVKPGAAHLVQALVYYKLWDFRRFPKLRDVVSGIYHNRGNSMLMAAFGRGGITTLFADAKKASGKKV